jgi:hypothetical protein
MSFYNGTTRFVVTIPCLNIALKIAHVHPIRFLQTLLWLAETHMSASKENRNGICKKLLMSSDEISLSPRWQFRGIYCNLREYWFYRRTANPFLWPTTFSLLGLVNVQPLAKVRLLQTKDFRLWSFVCKVTKDEVWQDNHTFSEEVNYTTDSEGHLRMLDYGSRRGQRVILKYGRDIYTQSRGLF